MNVEPIADELHVVVIDDLASFRLLLSRTLPFFGIQVVGEADRADRGFKVLESLVVEPDAVLVDVHMPRMCGIDAIGGLRERAPFAKILILSSDDEPLTIRSAVANGADGYLSKQDLIPDIAADIRRIPRARRSVRVG